MFSGAIEKQTVIHLYLTVSVLTRDMRKSLLQLKESLLLMKDKPFLDLLLNVIPIRQKNFRLTPLWGVHFSYSFIITLIRFFIVTSLRFTEKCVNMFK